MTYKDQATKPSRVRGVGDPDKTAEAEATVVTHLTAKRRGNFTAEEWQANRHPDFEAGDDARARQEASRQAIRIDRALERVMAEGLGPDDFARMERQVNKVLKERGRVDEGRLNDKLAHVADQMVNMILTGEVRPRSTAEAIHVAEAVVRIAGALKVDGAALAAAISYEEQTMDRRDQFRSLLARHTKELTDAREAGADDDAS